MYCVLSQIIEKNQVIWVFKMPFFMNYRIVIATLQLCQTKFKTFEPLIKLIMRIFTSMDNLAKHFLVRIKKVKTAMDSAKFDSLVKHVAKELTPKVYDLITFINDVSDAWQFQIKIIIIVFLRCLYVHAVSDYKKRSYKKC